MAPVTSFFICFNLSDPRGVIYFPDTEMITVEVTTSADQLWGPQQAASSACALLSHVHGSC
ncbi:hypothetical protein E2C01_017290 [Portunus trituberculatus]|uniref:Uncharacterized protein n=1 Tax=Portunus trituberculatus TaxID=210409 RepID=A0A5B7DT81_PORTR|nr:hypothetical protein [Portunus trituberculatus]